MYDSEKFFDRLNRETQEHNNRNVNRFNPSTESNYSFFNPYQQNYYNNQTYKQNNGEYSRKYY